MTDIKRGFKGIWIPREIWLSRELTIQEKIMLVEIDSLDNDEGCWAQNRYFAEFFGLSERRVQTVLKSLKDKGFIDIGYTYKQGTKEIDKRTIRITPTAYPRPFIPGVQETTPGGEENDTTPHEENDVGVVKETTQGGEENDAENNILSNNTVLIKPSSEKEKKKKEKAPAKAAAPAAPVPDFSGTGFSPAMIAKVNEWVQYKTERAVLERKKVVYTPTGLRNLISEIQNNVNRYGEQAVIDLITSCMGANYQGIIFDKLRNQPVQQPRAAANHTGGQSIPQTNNPFAAFTSFGTGGDRP